MDAGSDGSSQSVGLLLLLQLILILINAYFAAAEIAPMACGIALIVNGLSELFLAWKAE